MNAALPNPRVDLSERARAVGVVLWCSFLAAGLGTMVCFALIDPMSVRIEEAPFWWTSRTRVYTFGFFLFWLVAALSSTLAVFMTRTAPLEGR